VISFNTIKKHKTEFIVQGIMCTLVLVSLALIPFFLFDNVDHSLLAKLELVEISISTVFLIEFLIRLGKASDRRHYIKHYWWLLLVAAPIPGALGGLLNAFRLLAFVKLLRIIYHYEYEKIYSNSTKNKII